MGSRLADVELRPDVFAAVMATGIVSIAAEDHHYRAISHLLDWLAAIGLVLLVALVVLKLVVRRVFAFTGLDDPDRALRLFTFVAACAVVAARWKQHPLAFHLLGAVAVLSWLALVPVALHATGSRKWTQLRDAARGAWLLASVATSGLALLAAEFARQTGHSRLLTIGLALWALAVFTYCVITWLVGARVIADRSILARSEPDSWIQMGGLAIAALAGNHAYRAISDPPQLANAVLYITIAIWAMASLWIPPLIYLSVRRRTAGIGSLPSPGAWWAMVFPLGMYATATQATSLDAQIRPLSTLSLVFFWIALVVWVVVAIAGVRVLVEKGTPLVSRGRDRGRTGRR